MNRSNLVQTVGAGLAVRLALAVLALALAWPTVRYLARGIGATVATVNCLLSANGKCDVPK
jgi:hypothetical protein